MVIVLIMSLICVIAFCVINFTAFDKVEELSYFEGLGFPMVNDFLNKNSTVNANPRKSS